MYDVLQSHVVNVNASKRWPGLTDLLNGTKVRQAIKGDRIQAALLESLPIVGHLKGTGFAIFADQRHHPIGGSAGAGQVAGLQFDPVAAVHQGVESALNFAVALSRIQPGPTLENDGLVGDAVVHHHFAQVPARLNACAASSGFRTNEGASGVLKMFAGVKLQHRAACEAPAVWT